MTRAILISVIAGILAGYFFLPDWFIDLSGNVLIAGLCVLLFFVGMDIGREGTVVENFKKAGWRILIFPFVIVFGTLIGSLAGALILPSLGIRDALAIGSGFGWYTLAPVMLSKYSTYVSALSFMHNVMRELFGILLIPIVAKKIGYIETVALPGAAAMDVCLPIVEKATRGDIAVYSFLSGVVLSIAVPVLVGFIAGV
ncbi:lysine exporter LysO family protein [Anaerovorax odorimutans]|nr:lysine exporter LysO family protein [Anaerovorax odorimutans]